MEKTLGVAILAASEKNYTEFEQAIQDVTSQKMQNTLSGFIKHLEKNSFSK